MKRNRQIIKENYQDLDPLCSEFITWAMGDGAKSGRINPMGLLYEYYYDDNDDALLQVAEEFSDVSGYDIEEVYEAARKAANYYFHYNPVDLGESRQVSKKNTIKLTESELKKIISESVKQILKEGKYVNNRVPFGGGIFHDDNDKPIYVEEDPWYGATQTPEAKQKHKERVDRMWANKQRRLWYDYIWEDKNEVLNLLKNNYDSLIQEVEEDVWALQWQYAPEGRRISVHGDFEAWELVSGGYALIVRVGMEKKYAEDDE